MFRITINFPRIAMSLHSKNPAIADLPQILEVEKSWPEAGRASADKFIARIEKFSKGFFIIYKNLPSGEEKAIATITTMPMFYSPTLVGQFTTWDKVTNHGLFNDCSLAGKNALYIASGVIDKEHRGENVFEYAVLKVVKLAQDLGLRYVVAGAVIPGYKKYSQNVGALPAWDYCQMRKGSKPVDPLLAMYETIHFKVPNSLHVVSEYYPDDASRNYAALVVRDLVNDPLK
jgi:hypothetical protein